MESARTNRDVSDDFIIDPSHIHFNDNTHKLELESFSSKNSEAKYHKNLQFRNKLPTKKERENSTPSRMNANNVEANNNTNVDQYK